MKKINRKKMVAKAMKNYEKDIKISDLNNSNKIIEYAINLAYSIFNNNDIYNPICKIFFRTKDQNMCYEFIECICIISSFYLIQTYEPAQIDITSYMRFFQTLDSKNSNTSDFEKTIRKYLENSRKQKYDNIIFEYYLKYKSIELTYNDCVKYTSKILSDFGKKYFQ